MVNSKILSLLNCNIGHCDIIGLCFRPQPCADTNDNRIRFVCIQTASVGKLMMLRALSLLKVMRCLSSIFRASFLRYFLAYFINSLVTTLVCASDLSLAMIPITIASHLSGFRQRPSVAAFTDIANS